MTVPRSASGQPPEQTASAEADLARSQAEGDPPQPVKKPRRRRVRRIVVGLLVALSCLLVLLSATEVWAHRTLLSTGAFVATAGPVCNNPAVTSASATKGFVAGQLAAVMASPQFQAIWTATLTATHQLLAAVLHGQHTAAVSTSGGYIVLNTVPSSTRPWERCQAWPPA